MTASLIRAAVLTTVGIIALGNLAGASAQTQSEFSLEMTPQAPVVPTTLIEEHMLAQLGLGQGFISELLQSQLQIVEEEHGKVGVCKALDQGGSIKLVHSSGTFLARKGIVEIYYDERCTKVFIHASLTVKPSSKTSISFGETATVRRPVGTVLGKLTIDGLGTKASTVQHISGHANWEPASGAAQVHVGLKCTYPITLLGAKPFVCIFGMAQSFSALKLDLASLTTITFKVHEVTPKSFEGLFTGKVQFVGGALGRLHITGGANAGPITITGSNSPLGSAVIAGSQRLTVFSPPPTSWTVTDTAQKKEFAIKMAKGLTHNSTGTIEDTHTKKTLATFSVDESGDGSIIYSDHTKATIANWLLAD